MNLLTTLRDQFRPVLSGLVSDAAKIDEYLGMIKPAQNPEHGDYQANFAMPLAKVLGKKPPDVAKEIVSHLSLGEILEPPTIAGPGFINLRFQSNWLAKNLQWIAKGHRLGIEPATKPKTFVVDFSSVNVAKPLHVGHLRSTIIGESLCRILRFLGHKVIADNHLGDWGTQFGMLLHGYKNYLDQANYTANPLRELARLYKKVREEAKANDDDEGDNNNPIVQSYRQETAKLHQGDPENLALWNEFMPHCMEEIHAIYERLDVHFDHEYGESFYQPMLADVVEVLLAKGIAKPSEGAVIFQEKENGLISLIRKRDGAYTYTTTDLATIKYRVDTWNPDAMLYVVDFRQADHFKNLFAAGRKWGYNHVEMTHISFGSVLGKDGKPIKTREGAAVELQFLLDEAVREGAKKYKENQLERLARGEDVPELTPEEVAHIAEVVGLGAVKYADLSQNRTSDYRFDLDKMLATDGNTATYMQYAYVRCRGIFRKAEVDATIFQTNPPLPILFTNYERALALQLLKFEETLQAAASEYLPHILTGYLWDLSKAYSGFFVNCPVLRAESEELKQSRLVLCDLTARVLQQTLELLGIRTLERM